MKTLISPTGEIVRFRSAKAFADEHGFHASHIRNLTCGHIYSLRGYCSTHRRAAKRRKRFLQCLVHPASGTREIIGPSAKAFAQRHGLCANELYKLLTGKVVAYRGWLTEQTYDKVQAGMAGKNF